MTIPKELRGVSKEPTLIIAAGKQDAVLYRANGASIEALVSFEVEKPYFSDKEGGFMTRGRGKTMRAGGTAQEVRDQDIINRFIHEFRRQLATIGGAIARVYILAPAKTKNVIKRALDRALQEKVRGVIAGNFFQMHPIELLKKIEAVRTLRL